MQLNDIYSLTLADIELIKLDSAMIAWIYATSWNWTCFWMPKVPNLLGNLWWGSIHSHSAPLSWNREAREHGKVRGSDDSSSVCVCVLSTCHSCAVTKITREERKERWKFTRALLTTFSLVHNNMWSTLLFLFFFAAPIWISDWLDLWPCTFTHFVSPCFFTSSRGNTCP